MPKKEANLTAIMLVQQLENAYWETWEDKTPIQLARDGDCKPLLQAIVDKLNNEDISVKEAYGIKHDKDERTVWNQEEKKNVTEKKPEHIHFLFKFDKGASLSKIALATGVEPQYLEKLKSGRYGFNNCLAYLVHAKDETKYQYQPDEVVTILGEDYISIYNRNMDAWTKGRATKKANETNLSIDWLIEKILSGEITKRNIMLTDEYYSIYGQHKRRINEALETAGERKSYKTIIELEEGRFKKTIFFINANSGAGKTTLSKQLIEILQATALNFGETWDFCVTASKNAFDEYNGQDVLLLDDIRGDSLSVSDWLKLLDPYMISPISARYHNRIGSAKVIIITSIQTPISFFAMAQNSFQEDLGQFIRRMDFLVTIKEEDFKLYHPIPERGSTYIFPQSPMGTGRTVTHSYSFGDYIHYTKNQALSHLVKTVIRNMQWNKTKKVINASDQTNNDNQDTQQK